MKLSSTFFHTYFFVSSATQISLISFSNNDIRVENVEEVLRDRYHPSEPINEFEEDLYCKLLRHQRDFVPRINLYYSIVINHIQVINNTISTLFRRSHRYVEEISKGTSLLKKNKKKKFSSAFTQISNLAEE
ncbi:MULTISPECIES: hypothetical protein [Proteus]|jgi:hypothetical protein|uniref:Uncharacterized protein n=1 Tax=Proteus vulgaris TaxID=585 RepID=A0A379F806_PROVU|nr:MULTISPECIES: hypothetical protein [Proteus]NBN58945.1 hypothetical protein [Proteus sp. G2639]RNT22266.1 hypothetical protein B9475_017555 [Proteus mirabilis]AYY82689.1 hypothetical protein EGX81_18235 [Proteus vulgaris]KGA56043.1 hypothetical protein DR95_3334 [Proteus vulgaris]MBG5972841.1 hypothetical protein [Proteus vulgaris]